MEYQSVTFDWIGRGLTQEIQWLKIEGKDGVGWHGKSWTDFLNHMAQQKWELVTVTPLVQNDNQSYGFSAYFKRPI
ncbi:MAG: hypothetical protein AAF152_17500 [Cyanobacteria bacterium P01_A01_bin.114]